MSHNIVVDTKTWYVYPQLPLAGYVNAGEGLRGPHEPELYEYEQEWAARCAELGIETEENKE